MFWREKKKQKIGRNYQTQWHANDSRIPGQFIKLYANRRKFTWDYVAICKAAKRMAIACTERNSIENSDHVQFNAAMYSIVAKSGHIRCKRNCKTIAKLCCIKSIEFPKCRVKLSQLLWHLNLGLNIDKLTDFIDIGRNKKWFTWIETNKQTIWLRVQDVQTFSGEKPNWFAVRIVIWLQKIN